VTKKRKRSSSKQSTRKKQGNSLLNSILLVLVLLGGLFICNQLGLIEVNWQRIGQVAVTIGQQAETGDLDVETALDQILTTVEEEVQTVTDSPAAVVEPVNGEWYQLYFTTPHYPDEPATRVDLITQGLIQAIDQAQSSLDIAIYELDLDEIGEAILSARNRGVTVRLVTDTDELEELETLIRLEEAEIPIVTDERSPIMHNKFVVVDGQAVWTGSWNFTPNGTYRNNNNAIYIQSTQLAQNYTVEFEEMFSRHAFGPTSPANTPHPQIQLGDTLIETCFAPEDECAEQLIRLVNQAQQSIRFMAFSLTHDGLGQAIRTQAGTGRLVQGVFETRGSETEYSEYGRMQQQGLDVWQDGNPYTLHHKVLIIDDNTVVLGSFNFSNNADEANDENILVIHNTEIAGQFMAEFQRVYNQAQTPSRIG
jgi:phosphatidylserine/phosphatidylglycerophosphate/cardiolipin synthase-like enzyme